MEGSHIQGCQDRDIDREIVRSHASLSLHRVGAVRRSEKMAEDRKIVKSSRLFAWQKIVWRREEKKKKRKKRRCWRKIGGTVANVTKLGLLKTGLILFWTWASLNWACSLPNVGFLRLFFVWKGDSEDLNDKIFLIKIKINKK